MRMAWELKVSATGLDRSDPPGGEGGGGRYSLSSDDRDDRRTF